MAALFSLVEKKYGFLSFSIKYGISNDDKFNFLLKKKTQTLNIFCNIT